MGVLEGVFYPQVQGHLFVHPHPQPVHTLRVPEGWVGFFGGLGEVFLGLDGWVFFEG